MKVFIPLTHSEKKERLKENQKKYYARTHRSGEQQSSSWQLMFIGKCTFKRLCKIHKIKYKEIYESNSNSKN